jgi:hypothetical protein
MTNAEILQAIEKLQRISEFGTTADVNNAISKDADVKILELMKKLDFEEMDIKKDAKDFFKSAADENGNVSLQFTTIGKGVQESTIGKDEKDEIEKITFEVVGEIPYRLEKIRTEMHPMANIHGFYRINGFYYKRVNVGF